MLEFIKEYPITFWMAGVLFSFVIFLLYHLKNAELIDEETEKAMKIAILKKYFKNEKLNYENVLHAFSLPNENTRLLIENWTGILMTDEEILKVKKMLNNI